VQRREVSAILRESLSRLPVGLAETLTVFYMQEKSVAETAAILGVSEGTVKTRLHRGRELLRQPLEKILDEELRHLRPRRNLSPGIMAMLPGLTMKAGWSAGVSSIGLAFTGSQLILFAGMMWLSDILFQYSFKNPNDYRARIAHIDRCKGIFFIVITILTIIAVRPCLSEAGYWKALGVFCLLGAAATLPNSLRLWKVGNKIFLLREIILCFAGLAYLLIISRPEFHEFFFVPIIGFVFTASLTQNGKLMRQDMSLFLRAMKHDLSAAEEKIRSLELSPLARKEFSRFMGREMLVWGDEYSADGSWVLGLAPVRNNMFIPRSWRSLSKVHIDSKGNFTAKLSMEDLVILERIERRKISEAEVAWMEEKVAGVVKMSAMLFSQGKREHALRALSAFSESEIFKNGNFHKTPFARFHRTMIGVALVLMLAALFLNVYKKWFHS
jgi:hypothetical protein